MNAAGLTAAEPSPSTTVPGPYGPRAAAIGAALALAVLALLSIGPGTARAAQDPAAPPYPGTVHRNIDYRPDQTVPDGRDLLDVYLPERAPGAAQDPGAIPLVVFFHGGGLLEGDKAHGEILARRLASAGIGVVSANYRLSPAVMHPVHLQDAAAAVAWTVRHAQEYGADPDRIFVSGHSAGAYLATLIALDPAFLGAHDLAPDTLAGSVPLSPFLYVEETARDRPKTVWGENPAVWLEASVTPRIRPWNGRMLLVYASGDDDWRKAQNERFETAMRAAGNRHVEAVEAPGRDHVTILTGLNAPDDPVGDLIVQFVRSAPG